MHANHNKEPKVYAKGPVCYRQSHLSSAKEPENKVSCLRYPAT